MVLDDHAWSWRRRIWCWCDHSPHASRPLANGHLDAHLRTRRQTRQVMTFPRSCSELDPQTVARSGMTQVGRYPPARCTEPAAITASRTKLSDTSVFGCILPGMSLFRLPPGCPPQLAFLWPLIWPLIWVQILMLRAQIWAAYGRGVKYRWSVTDNLRLPGQHRLDSGVEKRTRVAEAACAFQ